MISLQSTTWPNHVWLLCIKYDIADPLALLQQQPPTKSAWKEYTWTKIIVLTESSLRAKARNNSRMEYLNVQLAGLSGRPHPALTSVTTTRDIPKLRLHLKFLTGDYPSYHRLARDRGTNDSYCRLCTSPREDTKHILTECRATSDH